MTRSILYAICAAGLAAVLFFQPAVATTVYSGCSAPVTNPNAKAFFIDPVNGSMGGNGSRTQPWHTLSEVIAAGLISTMPTHWDKTLGVWVYNNPKAPIQPGDIVYLLGGNHGAVTIQGWFGAGLVGYANSSFITITAFPGQTPVLSQLTIAGASKWLFQGLTIQSLNTTGAYLSSGTPSSKDYWLVSLTGPHNNIILDSNYVQSTTNVTGWTIGNWMTSRSSGIYDSGGTCISITNNTITNIGFGIQSQTSDQVLIYGNTINYFTDDGIDFGSNDMVIQKNLITNSVEDGDGLHRDGMQGQPYSESTTVNNVSIESNSVIRMTDPNLPFPGFLQGIDIFDGIWTDLLVTGNVIISDAVQGLSFYGVHTAYIRANWVLADNGKVLPCYGLTYLNCLSQVVVYNTSHSNNIPMLGIHASKAGVASTGVTVTQNIVTGLGMDLTDTNVAVSENLCIPTNGTCTMGLLINGNMIWVGAPGTYANNNVISNLGATATFVQFDTTALKYNVALLNPNPAIPK